MRVGGSRIAILLIICCIAAVLEWRHLRVAPLPAPGKSSTSINIGAPAYALLPESEATAYARLFSHDPVAEAQSWEPTVADIEGLEANLPQLTSLNENGAVPSRHIDDPTQYFRQYVAVVKGGQRTIFINALCSIAADDSGNWRKHLEIGADGGTCFWKAFYDPATQTFSNLVINGVG
jgi:hypothetical protein